MKLFLCHIFAIALAFGTVRSQVDQTQQKPASWFDKASNAFQTYVKPAASSLGQAASGTQQQTGGSPSWSDAANTLGSVFQNFGKSGSSGAQPPPPVVAQPPPPAAVAPPPAAIAQPAPAPGTQQQNPSSGSSWANAANTLGNAWQSFGKDAVAAIIQTTTTTTPPPPSIISPWIEKANKLSDGWQTYKSAAALAQPASGNQQQQPQSGSGPSLTETADKLSQAWQQYGKNAANFVNQKLATKQ